jgi:superfamily II DNA or RNA helicase
MVKSKSFKDIEDQIKPTYYTSDDDSIKDFMVPILKRCKYYKRESFSFSSGIFSLINDALPDMIDNGCKIEYIVGFDIGDEEKKAMSEGLENNGDLVEKKIKEQFGNIENVINGLSKRGRDVFKYRLSILSYLISKRLLKLKVGFVSNKWGIKSTRNHLYHPKIMIFEDFEGNVIVAPGSPNESLAAHARNEESFDVFKGWNKGSDLERIRIHCEKFKDNWENNKETIQTISIDKILNNDILSKYKKNISGKSREEIIKIDNELNKLWKEEISVNKEDYKDEEFTVKLWDHQKEVIEDWRLNKYKGIIKFATGAGKTLTALTAISRLSNEKENQLFTIIATPYQALSEQWYEETCKKFPEYKIVLAYDNRHIWEDKVNRLVNSYNLGINKNIIIITVNQTFSLEPFQNILKKIRGDKLIIADEVHHFGSKSLMEKLPYSFDFRMGLSATPERYGDPQGTSRILNYFGKILSPEFTLKDALKKGILSQYKYHPIITELKKDEEGGYWEISKKIQEIWDREENNERKMEKSKDLFNDRNEILNTASQKLIKLSELLLELNPQKIKDTLIYCHQIKHLEKVSSILFDLNISNARITSREPSPKERQNSFKLFKEDQRQVLLAVNCLDEGIDIPAIDTGFILASTANPKQFIQRRGRLLRKMRDETGKEIKKDVNIYDFISFPPLSSEKPLLDYEKEVIFKEIERIKEFSELAENKKEALEIIEKYLKKVNYGF